MKIARRFNAGNRIARDVSPEGTVELHGKGERFNRPFRDSRVHRPNPALKLKRRAIFTVSLRDKRLLNYRKGIRLQPVRLQCAIPFRCQQMLPPQGGTACREVLPASHIRFALAAVSGSIKRMLARKNYSLALRLIGLVSLIAAPADARAQTAPKPAAPGYEFRQQHDPNGIGKFYMGREIAHVMGHQAADWLERAEREEEEKPGLLLEALKLKPGEAVADIGAGSGYFSWRLAQMVGEKGTVYAVDIQQEMLDLLSRKMAERKINNVKPVLGSITNTHLPANSVDLAIMVDVYHEFSHPYEMMESIIRSLKPGGRVVFVEYRAEDPNVPIKLVHRMSEAQVRKEMAVHAVDWSETADVLPRQHIIIFRKRGATSPGTRQQDSASRRAKP